MIAVPLLGSAIPRTHGPLAAYLGRMALGLTGWSIEGALPDRPKFVLIVAPHTSNWDFCVGFCTKLALRLDCRFMAKQSLFWWPLGAFLRAFGGVAIDRSAPGDFVGQAARAFRETAHFVLAITPEGTRSKVAEWKSGFHRIAHAAAVPIALVVFDYSRKVVQLGPSFTPGEDYESDLADIRSHVAASMARHPQNY